MGTCITFGISKIVFRLRPTHVKNVWSNPTRNKLDYSGNVVFLDIYL